MDWKLFFSTFTIIFVAELPDKTAFATLLLATRGRPWPIFIGVAIAFMVQTLIAVCFGSLIGRLPAKWVHMGAGTLFLIFAALEWKKSLAPDKAALEEDVLSPPAIGFWLPTWNAFLVIFIAEWGDLTQLATATLSAQTSNPLTIFFAATVALWTVTALAVVLGQYAQKFINQKRLQRVAAIVFLFVGLYFIFLQI